MYKKNFLSLIFLLLIPTFMYSHSLLLNVFNNDNNTITIEGPALIGGFTKTTKKTSNKTLSQEEDTSNTWSLALIFTVALAFILLFLTIFISIKNTNILMKELKHS